MTPTQALAKVKKKFDLSTISTFDTLITDCIETASYLLAPYIRKPLTVATSVSLDQTDTNFTLPTSGSILKRLYLTYNDTPMLFTDWTQEGDTILLTGTLPHGATTAIYALGDYAPADIIPTKAAPGWVDFACAEFATTLAGSKSKYNIYAQQTGARGVDNMLDLAAYYSQEADRKLSRVADAEGIL